MWEADSCYNLYEESKKTETFIDQEYWHEYVNRGKTSFLHGVRKTIDKFCQAG